MKHRITNFGSEPLTIVLADSTVERHLQPGEVFTGEIGRVVHGTGRTHYSVRPAERSAGFAMFNPDEE